MPTLLLFGASGAIGAATALHFTDQNWDVVRVGRTAMPENKLSVAYNPLNPTSEAESLLASRGPFDAVCWAQGMNLNDSAYTVDRARHVAMYEANCLYIVCSLHMLLEKHLLTKPARLCVISSIWQEITRQDKFSYSMTKAALKGLVLSAAADLARDGHLINAVLPGVLETPMTRANLSTRQIESIERATQFHRLPALDDVVYAVWSLLSPANRGITGQFIKADLGFSDVRVI